MGLRGRTIRLFVATGLLAWAAPMDEASAQNFRGIPNWRYLPLQESFMASVEKSLESGSIKSVIQLALSQREKRKGTSEEGEARMALARACQRQGLVYCAYHFALTTARDFPGSAPALLGLSMLEQILKENALAERDIKRLINSGSFKEIPETLGPMMAYYVALDNSEKGLLGWVAPQIKLMGESNFWQLRWKYLTALEDIRRGKAEDGVKRLEGLLEQAASEPSLQTLIRWQLARLKFEQTDYETALRLYNEIAPAGRISGRALYERAWSHYYRAEYAEVLGLLQSLKAPSYESSFDPEQYLLEMLTLRRLCHFKAVKAPAAEFREKYQNSIEHIRKRKPLSDDLELVRLSFAKASFEPMVATVTMIREEAKRLRDTGGIPDVFRRELKAIYEKAEAEFREDVEILLRKDLYEESARLIDLTDQIQLVEYLSGLDAFRIEQGYEKRDYEASKADWTDFKTLFWPVLHGEHWLDELKNYRVLVDDQCSERVRK